MLWAWFPPSTQLTFTRACIFLSMLSPNYFFIRHVKYLSVNMCACASYICIIISFTYLYRSLVSWVSHIHYLDPVWCFFWHYCKIWPLKKSSPCSQFMSALSCILDDPRFSVAKLSVMWLLCPPPSFCNSSFHIVISLFPPLGNRHSTHSEQALALLLPLVPLNILPLSTIRSPVEAFPPQAC